MDKVIIYLRELFPSASDDTLLTIVITIAIFISGFLIGGIIRYIESGIKKKRIRDDIRSICSEILNSLVKQEKNFENFVEKNSIDSPVWEISFNSNHHITAFKEYGFKEMRNSFLTYTYFWKNKINSHAISKLFQEIAFIEELNYQFKDDYFVHNERFEKNLALWHKNLTGQRDLFDRKMREVVSWQEPYSDNQQKIIEFLNGVVEIRREWLLLGDKERVITSNVKKLLIDPLTDYCRSSQLADPIIPDAFNYLLDAKHDYSNIEAVTNSLMEIAEHNASEFRRLYRSISQSSIYNSKF